MQNLFKMEMNIGKSWCNLYMFNPKDSELRKVTMIIYQIRNVKNNKSYIGQSTKTFCRRYNDGNGWWKPSKVKCNHLSNAVAKYGLENFEVRILEKNVKSVEELNRLEILYIKQFNSMTPNGYNHHPGGINTCHWTRSMESRDRMALTQSGGKKHRLLNNKTGKIHEFINITRFAEEHDLSVIMLVPLLKNVRYSRHKEWSLPEKPIKKTRLLSPEGVEHVILQGEISGFWKKQGFSNNSGLFAMLVGKVKSACGWTLCKDSP